MAKQDCTLFSNVDDCKDVQDLQDVWYVHFLHPILYSALARDGEDIMEDIYIKVLDVAASLQSCKLHLLLWQPSV